MPTTYRFTRTAKKAERGALGPQMPEMPPPTFMLSPR